MSDIITDAVCYHLTASCRTPLRSGGAEGSMETVLQDRNFRPYLQGSSLAGVMRAWMDQNYPPEEVEKLFGGGRRRSSLTVSDGIFDRGASVTVRPRLAIDPVSGTARSRHKFDVAHVSPDSSFRFELTLLVLREAEAEKDRKTAQIEQMLAAIDRGEIRFGGQTSNGFGRVTLTVEKRDYHLADANDRAEWLEDRWCGVPMTLPERTAGGQVCFTVTGYLPRFLIKSGSISFHGASLTEQLREGGRPVIPGSSIKGTVLSRVRSIAQFLQIAPDWVDDVFGRMNKTGTGHETDNGRPCRFRFEDAYPLRPKTEQTPRIRIDRISGGVMNRALFWEESVSGNLTLRITGPENAPAACGLLLFALRDLGLGLYHLGSGAAVGRGVFSVSSIEAQSTQAHMMMRFDENRQITLEDPDGLAASWMNELGGIPHES